MKEAIILAGGLGTRLRHAIKDTQKVMAPVKDRPFIKYVLDDLINKGFERFIFAVSYKHEQIKEYFGDEYRGIPIIYSVEEEPLGTGGAIKKACSSVLSSCCAIINGDTFFDVDFDRLLKCHRENKCDITLSCKKMYSFSRYGTVNIDSSRRVISFNEKKYTSEGLINGGIYIINKNIFDSIKENKFSFEKAILENDSFIKYCEIFEGFFIDIGIPEDYFSAAVSIPLYFGEKNFKALFLDRDGVICKEKHHLYKCSEFEFTAGAADALARLREMGYLLIVITNQAGIAKGLYTKEDAEKLNSYMCSLLSDKTHIDAVYYCPYHEDGIISEYRKFSPDRKPGDGMIKRALRDFKNRGIYINIKESVLIGDKETDIAAGIKAGIKLNILVRSGHKIDEENTKADKILGSLSELPVYLKGLKEEIL